MRLLILIGVLLSLVSCFLAAETGIATKGDDTKETIEPQVILPYNPPVIIDRNEPKEADHNGIPPLPVQVPSIGATPLKEANPIPVQVDYQPVLVNPKEPKETNPVYTPSDYDPQIIDRNEPKETVIGNAGGQTRVDPDAYEPDDTAATAKYLSATSTLQSQNHTLHSDYDVDWYYFYGIPGRTYTFYSTSSIDNFIYLYQDNGTTQLDWDDDDGAGMNFYLQFSPTVAANYRFKVGCYFTQSGAYVIYYQTSATPDSYELDDSVAYAQQIYSTPSLQTQNHTIHNATDVDWFKFQGLTGRIYTFFSSGNLDDRIWLYQSDGVTLIASDDDTGEGNNFSLQFVPASNAYYYLKVDPYPGNAGAYVFCFSHGANADAYEPDNGGNSHTSIDAYTLYAQSQAHTLHTTTDQDWYIFLALVGVTYHFWSTGNEDTQIYIYDQNTLAQVAWNDDSGEGNNYDLAFTSNTTYGYLIKVVGYANSVGAYNFWYRHDDSPDTYENDDTSAFARTISPSLSNTIEQHTYDTWLDEDWFRFQGFKGLVYNFYSSDGQYHMFDIDDRVYLYQDDGTTLIDWDDDDGDLNHFSLQFAPTVTGYYRLKTVAYNGGVDDYAFNYYYTVAADAYEADNTSTTYRSITPSVIPLTQEHTLHVNTDQDWYRFLATAGRLYTFTSTGSMDNIAYLYNDDGTTLVTSDDDSGVDYNFNLAWNCTTSGYYKLKVIGYSGALGYYLLTYIYGAVPDAYEPDNTSSTAAALSLTAFLGTQTHTLHNDTDQDWFRFQGVATKRYTFFSTGDTDTQIFLYQDNGTTLIAMDDDNGDGNNFNLQYVFPTTAYYKLKVIGYYGAAGSYNFYHIFGAQPDGFEPDDSATQYTSLTVTTTLQTQTHTIDDAYDVDWFRFYGIAGQTYTFYSTGTTDMRVHLYNDAGTTQLATDDNSGDDSNFNLQYIPTTTAYYKLRVSPIMNEAGPYGFRYRYAPLGSPVITDIYRFGGVNLYIAWNHVSGATSYKIYTSSNPLTGFTYWGTTTGTALIDNTTSATRKFYRITANN
jgi:hypothetical protein